MHWELGRYVNDPAYFSSEAVDDRAGGEGEIYVTVFLGPRSEKRAREYTDWANGLLESQRNPKK
jgi:hypothetical protein